MKAELLEKIGEFAELQFGQNEIALILGITEKEIDSPEAKTAYQRGQLKAEAEVRKSIFQMAKQGSSPAQKQMLEIIEKNKITHNNKTVNNKDDDKLGFLDSINTT